MGYGKVLTAGGQVILPSLDGHGPANGSFDRARLTKALAAFKQLPAEQRQPRVEDLPAERRKAGYPPVPKGGLILKLHGRAFGLDDGEKVHPFRHAGDSPMLDYFWMTAEEVKALIPSSPKKGDSHAVPAWFVRRFRNYRLLSESLSGNLPTRVSRHPDRAADLKLTVDEVSTGEVRLRMQGSLPIRYAGWDVQNRRVADGDYDCDYEFLGFLTYDRTKDTFTRFDVVALGTVKQLGAFKYPRPEGGTLTIGVNFQLADGSNAESVPPYGLTAGRLKEYFAHDD